MPSRRSHKGQVSEGVHSLLGAKPSGEPQMGWMVICVPGVQFYLSQEPFYMAFSS